YGRVAKISKGAEPGSVDDALLQDDAERAVWTAFSAVESTLQQATLAPFVEQFQTLVGPIDEFFEKVMVMADDEKLRANRLHLLARIRATGEHLIDWEQIPEV